MSSKKPKTIDLFCGAGGSSYGARNAGADIVAGFDIWGAATTTFQANFSTAKVFKGDLRYFSFNNIRRIKSIVGDIDLILASPECTNHSKAKGSGKKSEASRETAFEVIRFAKVFKPSWMVIENVVEMQSWYRYKDLLEELWGLKYFIRKVVLNAKDFGVPQSRERLFLLCSLSGKVNEPDMRKVKTKPVSTIIDDTGRYSFSPLIKEGRAKNTILSAERAIEALGENTPFLLVYYGSARKNSGNGNGSWQRIDEPLRTITTLDRFAYVVPSEAGHKMRMLQPEELKLAMGYRQDFKLDDVESLTRRQRVKLMGNGVCPPVMEKIVDSLILNN